MSDLAEVLRGALNYARGATGGDARLRAMVTTKIEEALALEEYREREDATVLDEATTRG